jgi:hypothetical protein
MLNNPHLELVAWVPYILREWYLFNLLWYYEWFYESWGIDISSAYDHERLDLSKYMFPYEWIPEDATVKQLDEAKSSFFSELKKNCIPITWISERIEAALRNELWEDVVEEVKPLKKNIVEPKGSNKVEMMLPEIYSSLTEIKTKRGVNYNTLKKGLWARVHEIWGWYALSEDIVKCYLKQYKKRTT